MTLGTPSFLNVKSARTFLRIFHRCRRTSSKNTSRGWWGKPRAMATATANDGAPPGGAPASWRLERRPRDNALLEERAPHRARLQSDGATGRFAASSSPKPPARRAAFRPKTAARRKKKKQPQSSQPAAEEDEEEEEEDEEAEPAAPAKSSNAKMPALNNRGAKEQQQILEVMIKATLATMQ